MAVHLVQYTAITPAGVEAGVARVRVGQSRLSERDCSEQIPGFFDGVDLGIEPQYTLTYTTAKGQASRTVSGTKAVSTIGALVNRAADRGEAWDIKVSDRSGADVTFDFACFR